MPTESTTTLRRQLRAARDAIADGKDRHAELRASQLEQLRVAADNGAKASDAVDASGLSRAYLHKVAGGPVFRRDASVTVTPERAGVRDEALAEARRLGATASKLQSRLAANAEKRAQLIRKLLELDVDQPTIAEQAGVSAEWIRRLAKKA